MPFTSFFSDATGSQTVAISLDIAMLSIVGCCLFMFCSGIYRLCPGWGPVRRFDSDGNEEQRARENLLQREHAHRGVSAFETKEYKQLYGAIGKPTWGTLEAPQAQEVWVNDPVYGQVKVRGNFEETQRLRRESTWWAKDERRFMKDAHLRRGELLINDPSAKLAAAV
ncbi:unnamed protein product [Effrenium voratum]|uniref:Uncharacterized protein n=1 Tax=Effrenium voratum TaxID=2562239 RepID=A0AA36MTV7_9DINO|nr:unnamed protein product [Effrenium voratum]CAJ1385740.1 unnamed protein product [Effrenium voratum]CAJ1457358.1 unnamed protein product [Effrenium voratum]|mmetsp:Transcript_32001/g.76315  ORF Transcript_32001/g.76315 Transcript_32001/m.76315 type:complete len:168 (+) Transcript_32001:119-622(+)